MSLANIVSKAYIVFDYTRPMMITNVCTTCCVSAEDARKLITLPLSEIPLELISEYNDGAQATNYNMDEFKYFLPRYLDLLQQFKYPSVIDVSLSLKNLNYGNTQLWKKTEEKLILEEFAAAFMLECLAKESLPEGEKITSMLSMFYTAQIPVEPLLDVWKNHLNLLSMNIISDLLLYNLNESSTYISGGFMTKELSSLILDWIRANKDQFIVFIEDFIMNSDNKEKFQELSYCYDFLKYF